MPSRHHFSLRTRVTLGLFVSLTIVLVFLSYLEYADYRALLIGNLHASAARAGDIVKGSLLQAMTDNDFTSVARIMHDVASQPDVVRVLLLDKEGRVLLSTDEQERGKRIDLSEATCQACHRYDAASRNESMILPGPQNAAILRNVNALENAPECQGCHDPQTRITGVLISDFSMAEVQAQSLRVTRNRLLWSLGSTLAVLLIVNGIMGHLVIRRIEQLGRAVSRIIKGDLKTEVADASSDEIGVLAQAFNRMTGGLRDKAELQQHLEEKTQELQAQTMKLATLNTVAYTVSRSLNLEEILHSALEKVLELLSLRAGWIVLRSSADDHNGTGPGVRLVASHGLPEDIALLQSRCTWQQWLCAEVIQQGQARVCHEIHEHDCPVAEHFRREGLAFRTCIPIQARDRILGVMSLTADGVADPAGISQQSLDTLMAIGQQIGIAVENASLYEKLRQQEVVRGQLLERLIAVQEEERKRIALELHDQTGQPLTSLIMTLEVLENSNSLEEIKGHLRNLQNTAGIMLEQVHNLTLELRPRVLDDLGLPAAVRQHCREFQDQFRIPVDFQVLGFECVRLLPAIETALYRIVQEALTNVARHAHASSVSVLLEIRGPTALLIIEDDGQGFDAEVAMISGPGKMHLGLHGMRERAALLNGTLTIESTPRAGTALFVEIPLVQDSTVSP